VLRPGDVIVAVDGVRGPVSRLSKQIASHRCAGRQVPGCTAATPVVITVKRGSQLLTFSISPRYDPRVHRVRLGFEFADKAQHLGPLTAARISLERMWSLTSDTVTGLGKALVNTKARNQVTSVVGFSEVTQKTFSFDPPRALVLLAFISLVLAIVNLFPFLPLDGGHVAWAVAEKVRGRPIPFSTMARFSSVGVVLLIFLVISGVSNDISRLTGPGFR
jgi:regulator of sigma E protease